MSKKKKLKKKCCQKPPRKRCKRCPHNAEEISLVSPFDFEIIMIDEPTDRDSHKS